MIFTDIWNTPGFFYAIGYSYALAIALSFEKTEGSRRRRWLVWAAVWLFISMLMEVTGGTEGAIYVFPMLAVVCAMFACMYFSCRDVARAAFLSIKSFI